MNIERKSPVDLPARPSRTEQRQGWNVVLEYAGETGGPQLIDLSHCPRWDLQNGTISDFMPFGAAVPDKPGESLLERSILISRMNATQASIWCLSKEIPDFSGGPAFTEVTEGQLLLALAGRNIFSITEKLTSLEFADPEKKPPFILLGPFSHVPCQVAVLERNGRDGTLLLVCSRSYGHDMAHAILDAGREFGLRPAGEDAFAQAMKRIEQS